MALEIRPVRTGRQRRAFVDFPFRLYKDDRTWIPPLRKSVLDRISPKHPANEHQENALWMAFRDGKPVGRIGACVDRMFNEFQDLSWAWVGFFDAYDDQDAANTLFDVACQWGAGKGAEECVGPGSFTTNDEVGLLVDGFDTPPMILTTENPRYYERLWLEAGWEPAMDLWAWRFERGTTSLSDRQRRALERLRIKADLTIRTMRMDDFDAEVDRFFQIYQSGWARNWGFAPMTEAEVKHLAKDLKQIIDPELVLIVEKAGEPVGVSLSLPDANEPMAKVRSGRLLPAGWWHLLRGLKKTTGVRVFALGVRQDVQSRAVGPLLYSTVIDDLLTKPHITRVEGSWILATNHPMNSALEAMGGTRYKTWRMYRRKALPA